VQLTDNISSFSQETDSINFASLLRFVYFIFLFFSFAKVANEKKGKIFQNTKTDDQVSRYLLFSTPAVRFFLDVLCETEH